MSTLAAELKVTIEAWADELRQNPVRALAAQGRVTPRALAVYLESLRYLFGHSERNLREAAERARMLGLLDLEEYFASKSREENGHAGWASSDLTRLPAGATDDVQPTMAVLELVSLQRRLIGAHPFCFLGYSLLAEYLTALLGDEWMDALGGSGYERSQLSAVAQHLEADRAHATHAFAEADVLWRPGYPDLQVVLSGMSEAKDLFGAFCDEIYREAKRDGIALAELGVERH